MVRSQHILGTITYYDGKKYEGEWKKDKKDGKGIFNYGNDESYEGDFKNDLRSGYGVYTSSNGEKWEGQWVNNNKADEGRPDDLIAERSSRRPKPGEDIKEGTIDYPNGDSYTGASMNEMKPGIGNFSSIVRSYDV